ncbi:hypothetical protein [Brevundimonas subvibrioides]|uniref:Uncharacterized protein n=1 Tax=Brevundimonas subvibrioides (strain ATCC 15264 / DSM 4735 / LMG 14903 / NBRC 16000 / CB 81) TaxID=633149 RepID=D9QJV1_BRESC|nr:hypothetical protein [Brevundimonas subvibrioides]ADK99702.1 hypothetical protein Bresu_0388 [Brevundimonas subvibrioides ATCC 15264]
MKKMIGAAVCALMMLAAGGSAMAQDGDEDDYTFTLYNNSSSTILTFKLVSQYDDDWSEDLIPTQVIAPGDEIYMTFNPNEDECEYPTAVTLSDGSEFADVLNYCGIDGVAVDDDGIRAY